ncbi:MAG: TonB-dependent receptor [Saprospiraceae bacterium]
MTFRHTFSFLFSLMLVTGLLAQGSLSGTILDGSNGDVLIGATVLVKETGVGTATDFDGKYQINNVTAGTYSLEISYIGYSTITIEEVVIKDNEVTYLDYSLADDAVALSEVVVTAKVVERSETALLLVRRKAEVVQDNIGADEMSRYAANDAAGALKKVTGTTVQGGKYIYVRGLGDRYSLTQLNGLIIPSTDPYRNSAQLDLIPTNLLDNITTTKTFTPDQPGTFTGGNVDITTKSFPETRTLSIGVTTGYNAQANLIDNFLTHTGGDNDYWGYDGGARSLSPVLTDEKTAQWLNSAGESAARRGTTNAVEAATALQAAADALIPEMGPTLTNSPLDHGFSISYGNQFALGEKSKLGLIASGSFKQDYSHRQNFLIANYQVFNINSDTLMNQGFFDTNESVYNPTLNGLLGAAVRFNANNDITFNFIYNHSAEKTSTDIFGEKPDNIINPRFLNGYVLSFQERELVNYQLGGKHVFPSLGNFRIDWRASLVNSSQLEPQTRYWQDAYNIETEQYSIGGADLQNPFLFWRELQDEQISAKVDFTLPFGKSHKFKFGGYMSRKDREFAEYQYGIATTSRSAPFYEGDPNVFVANYTGIIDTNDAGDRFYSGNFVEDRRQPNNVYTGFDDVNAAYGMVTYQLMNNLKFVGGARVETTDIFTRNAAESQPDSLRQGQLDDVNVLPSANLIWEVVENMNIRASFTQTIARPNMREVSPYYSFDPIQNAFFRGNVNLDKTDITNLDLRWEYFFGAGEVVALSGYYKDFKNPIVQQFIRSSNIEIQFANVPNAELYGIELELRKNLDFIEPFFRDFRFNTNLSLIQSSTDVIDEVFTVPTARPFEGQPNAIVNAAINYINADRGWDATLSLNYVGDRMRTIGRESNPDLYDKGRVQLDFNLIKKINNFDFRFSVRNITNDRYVIYGDFKDTRYIFSDFRYGVDFGFGVTYTFRPRI